MPACHCQLSTARPAPLRPLRSKLKKRSCLELDVLLVAMLEKWCYSGSTQASQNGSSSCSMHGFHLSHMNFNWSPTKPHQP